jgi:hypothetical protein
MKTVANQNVIKLTFIIGFLLAMANISYYQSEVSAQLIGQSQLNTTQSAAGPMVSPLIKYSLSQNGTCSGPGGGMPTNYLNMICTNTLVNTTNQIDNLQCDKESGWIANCVWHQQPFPENGTGKIFAASSLTGGANWNLPPQLLSDNSSNAFDPILGMSHEKVFVVFLQDSGDGLNDVYLAQSNDGGMNWTLPAINISNDTKNVTEVTLNVDEGNGDLLVGWVSGTPGGDPRVTVLCWRC